MEYNTHTEDYQTETIELLKLIFPEADAGDSKYFNWKYNLYPYKKTIVIKAVEDNKIVGTTSLLPQKIIQGDISFDIALSVDTAIKEEHRDLAVFYRLLTTAFQQCQDNNIGLFYSMANNNAKLLVEKVMKCKKTFSFIPYIYIPLRMKVTTWRHIPLKVAGINNFKEVISKSSRICKINEIRGNVKSVDSSLQMEADYYNYRYFQCPTRIYEAYEISHNNYKYIVVGSKKKMAGILLFVISDVLYNFEENIDFYYKVNDIGNLLATISEQIKIPLVYFSPNDIFNQRSPKRFLNMKSVLKKRLLKREFDIFIKTFNNAINADNFRCSMGDIDVG